MQTIERRALPGPGGLRAHWLHAGALCAALAGTGAALAQGNTKAATQLDPIQVTASRVPTAAADTPQAVTIVGAEAIARGTPRIATDLLRGQPGVFLQSSGPGQGIVIVRGLKGSEVLHLVDGMRLNMTFFRNSPNQYLALIDPFNLEQIEVLRGSGATLYGSDAMGGVVQFLTPEQRFDGETLGWRAGAKAQFGSHDLSRAGRAWAAFGNGGFSVSGGITALDIDSYDSGNGGRLPNEQVAHRAGGYDVKALWTPAPGHELMLSAQSFEYPNLPRYFEISAQPNSNPAGVPQRTDARFKPNSRDFLHARYRLTHPFLQADSLELHLARQVIDDDRSVIPQRPTEAAGRRELEHNRSTLDGLTLQLDKALRDNLRLVYGLDLYRDAVDSTKRCEPLAGNCGATTVVPVFADGSEQDSGGLYGLLQWRALDTWRLEAGLRYSRVRTDLTETALSPAATVDDDDITGHLASQLTLRPGLSWTANVARGFRAPNLFDLGTLGPRGGSTQINVPNPGLQPETVIGADTGLRWSSPTLKAEVVGFWSRYRDRIEAREPTGNTIPNGSFGCAAADGCPEVQSRNISEARYWGLESGLRWTPVSMLDLYAVVNLTRGTEQRDGEARTPANRVPPINGQLGLRYAPLANVEIEPYLLWADEQRRLDADDQGDIRIAPGGTPGWGSLNLRLGWTPTTQTRVQLTGHNLLDQGYREHGSGIDAPGAGVVLSLATQFN
ncbi:MAG TPA: TonB-dependent receptor [Solimonas sp.]